MSVSQLSSETIYSSVSSISNPSPVDDGATIDQEEFLELLITQLEFQDPLNPMDTEQFTSQLTDFSSLEQQIQTNKILTEISENLSVSSQNNLVDYIGKEVTTSSNTLNVNGSEITGISFTLPENGEVEMTIYDGQGNEVNRIQYGETPAGTHEIQWAATDSTGLPLDDGQYFYTINAQNSYGNSISVDTAERGEVTGITYQYGTPQLIVGGNPVDPSAVIEIQSNSTVI